MYNCIVCGNYQFQTKITRPEVVYHAFPKNTYVRKQWIKICGIQQFKDRYRICSDHFLEENYRPGKKRYLLKNVLPQSYDKKCFKSRFPYNNTNQINDTQLANNEFKPIVKQNLVKEEPVENDDVNNFVQPRRSCRKIKLTTTSENMCYESMPWIQTDRFEAPTPTTVLANDNNQSAIKTEDVSVESTIKDYTLGNGLCCSVKNCFNRYSNGLSFFGFPSDLALRKIWVEKCGLEVTPTKKIKACFRVCSVHFDTVCFKNPQKKNRLKSDAIPSLFLDEEIIIEERNNPSTSSSINSEFVHVNKPSCSSSSYVADVDSEKTPLLVYIDSTTRYTKDFDPNCCIPGCITNCDTFDMALDDITLFAPPIECVDEWSSSLGLQLTVNSIVCERHFRPQDMLYPELLVNGVGEIIKSLAPHALPMRSVYDAMPFKNNVVPSSRIRKRRFKSAKERADKQLSTNKINKVLDNTDKCSTTNISTSIDDFPCIEPNLKQKLKNISAYSSLSITLEPSENSQAIEPSVNSFSKPTSSSSMSITLQPKPKHNLTSTINNNVPSVNLTHSFPSTSNSSVNNLSQQCLLEHEQQEATSSFKTQDILSSNSIMHPEFFGNQIKVLKPISLPTNICLTVLTEINTPVISKFTSLTKKSNTHDSNFDNSMDSPKHLLIDEKKPIDFVIKDNGFIFKISQRIELPNLSWTIVHISSRNETSFLKVDSFGKVIKEIHFCNSFFPVLKIYSLNYNHEIPITSRNQLIDLLDKTDKI